MKIGEAGEAFFVFETAEEVPDELITSPLLEATRSPDIQGRDARAGGFETPDRKDEDVQNSAQLQQFEPDFLDLNAPSTSPASDQTDPNEKDTASPSSLLDRVTTLGASVGNTILEKERDEFLRAREKAKTVYQSIAHHGTTDPRDVSPSRDPEDMPSEPIYHDGVQNPPCALLLNSNVW